MLVIGDKVEVIEYSEKKYIGNRGEVIYAGTGIKSATQPVIVNLPKEETEPRYIVKLDNGKVLQYIREQQLRKL
jgi:RNase P/RNase MRP subunit p29